MSCLPQWKRTQLQAKLIKLRAQSIAVEDVIDKAILSGNLSNIEFDSGEGKQKSGYRSLNELQKYSMTLDTRIEQLENRLLCKGLINIGMKR